MTASSVSASNILNVRFGLRSRLHATAYHTHTTSIPKEELTPEKEPELHTLLAALATELAATPDLFLTDTYSPEERRRDWLALKERPVLDATTGAVLPIDARSRPGHKLLDHHMPHFYDVANYTGRSVRSVAMDPTALHKALLSNVAMHSTPYKSEIRRMLTMTAGLSNVTKYRALTAKAIVTHFGATRVLDPCIGWGGRMLGALAAGPTVCYIGCEPDPRTFAGLNNILADLPSDANATPRTHLFQAPAEVAIPALPATTTVDMVLTSPPYYNLEVYHTAETQSTVAHSSWEDWRDNWLRPVILACLGRLRPTGTSCWSVKNFRTDRFYPLADEVARIHQEAGWRLVETITMTGSGRPGGGRIVGGKESRGSEEETFCFKRV